MNDGTVYLSAEDAFYSYDGPQAEIIHVVSEGNILASAYLYSGSGRYANTPEPGPSTILYRDYELCLRAGFQLHRQPPEPLREALTVNESERQEWNAAVQSGDAVEIDRLRKRILTAISLKIMTEDEYQARTH